LRERPSSTIVHSPPARSNAPWTPETLASKLSARSFSVLPDEATADLDVGPSQA